jgi:hypothetical protein
LGRGWVHSDDWEGMGLYKCDEEVVERLQDGGINSE